MYQILIPSLKKRSVRSILFDLAETLWINKEQAVWEKEVQARNRRAAELLRVYFPENAYVGRDHHQLSIELRSAISERYTYWRHHSYDREPDAYLITTEACWQLGLPPSLDKEQVFALLEAFRERLPATRQLFDDTLTTLHELRARGFLLGCITDRKSGGSGFLTDLQQLGLLECFSADAIIISADCGWRKPHPTLFQKALSALSADPEEAAVVGDFLSRDIAGAKRLNMVAVWKPKLRLFCELQTNKGGVAHPLDSETLLTYALQQERERHPEVPIDEIGPFTRPDCMIEHLSDLLTLFISPGLLFR